MKPSYTMKNGEHKKGFCADSGKMHICWHLAWSKLALCLWSVLPSMNHTISPWYYLYFWPPQWQPEIQQSRKIQLGLGTFANFSAEVRSISFSTVCQNVSQGNMIYHMATMQLGLLQQGDKRYRQGLIKMMESNSPLAEQVLGRSSSYN